jgi:hypothetical protein
VGIEVRKIAFYSQGVRIKFETMQTIEEILFAIRRTKEKMLQAINQEPHYM